MSVANNDYELCNTGAISSYLDIAMFSPSTSSLLQAINNGHLTTLPGLTEQEIEKKLNMAPATAMGHMNQRRHNIRSASKVSVTSDLEDETVKPAGLGSKPHSVYAVVVDQRQLYTDLRGIFQVRSSKGNWYVMMCYYYDYNYMKAFPMKSRSDYEWLKAYGNIHQ
jgi:hypothetical protein